VTEYVQYEVDFGFDAANEEAAEWRDVFVNVRPAVFAQVQGGKFKIPFGYERLTGPRNLDFVYRSRVSDALTPGRFGRRHGPRNVPSTASSGTVWASSKTMATNRRTSSPSSRSRARSRRKKVGRGRHGPPSSRCV